MFKRFYLALVVLASLVVACLPEPPKPLPSETGRFEILSSTHVERAWVVITIVCDRSNGNLLYVVDGVQGSVAVVPGGCR